MKQFDYNKYLKNNPLLKNAKRFQLKESLLQINSVSASPNEKPGVVDTVLIDKLLRQIGPYLGYFDWEQKIANPDYKAIIQKIAKHVSGTGTLSTDRLVLKEMQEGDIEESFKDTIAARRTTKKTGESTPTGDLATIFDAVKKEAAGDYKVVYKDGAIYIMPDLASGVVGRIIGVVITQDPGNKAITVGFTNGTIDNSGATHMTQGQRFNPKDIQGILDMCADMIDQVTSEDESSGTVDEVKGKNQDGDETWFSDANYFKKEHAGYKLKPTDMVSIGDIPPMTYAQAVKKFGGGKFK
jgi:hypothetical protein